MDQDEFDHFLLSHFSSPLPVGALLHRWYERNGEESPSRMSSDLPSLLAQRGLDRVPAPSFHYTGVGVWLMQAYPQFADVVARSGDARKVVLKWLRFEPPARPRQPGVRRTKTELRARANLIAAAAYKEAFGALGHPGRIRTPMGRRKA